jgi:peptidoglycan-N-acetylglucosamine deacetylase
MRNLITLTLLLSLIACTAKPQAIKTGTLAEIGAPMIINLYRIGSGGKHHFRLVPGIITHGPRDAKRIALTFDADMTPGMARALDNKSVASYNNTRIYKILERTHTKATFFLAGMWIERYRQETKRLARNPLFELENHSYSHPAFALPCYGLPGVASKNKLAQLEKTRVLLKKVAGIENHFFRFPGGCSNTNDVKLAGRLGLEVIGWDAAGEDGGQANPQVIEHRVLSKVHNGSIIVLHSHGGPKVPVTQDALPLIIASLKARGFEFVKLSELLEP